VTIGFQIGALIQVRDGQDVGPGEVLARIPVEGQKTRDITGGLPRVAELFEARSPKDKGMLAEMTGTVSFGKETKGKVRLQITDPDGKVWEELMPKEKNILVHEGQVVNKGEPSSTARPIRRTSCVCWASRSWRATSSMRCRTSTACRA
jgi:DNA-directed RNA polymerase subunit beta'